MTETRPANCRFRLQEEGKPYPRSSCQGCGLHVSRGLGSSCSWGSKTTDPDTSPEAVADLILVVEQGVHHHEVPRICATLRALSAAHAAAIVRERDANAKAMQHLRRAEAAEAQLTALKAELAEAVEALTIIAASHRGQCSDTYGVVATARAFLARHQKGAEI